MQAVSQIGVDSFERHNSVSGARLVAFFALTHLLNAAQLNSGPQSAGATRWVYVLTLVAVAFGAGLWLGRRRSRSAPLAGSQRRESADFAGIALPANDIVLLVDEGGRIVDANDRALECYGYEHDELIGMNLGKLRYGIEQDTWRRHWNETEDRGSLRFETIHKRRDGSPLPVEVSSRMVRVGGRAFRQSIIRDITERKNTEDKLKKTLETLEKSEAQFRLLVEKAPEAIIIESRLSVRYANSEAIALIGAKGESDVLGLSMLEFTHPDERDHLVKRSELVATGHSVPAVERRILTLQGEVKHVEASAAPIEFEGSPASLVFFRDVSERRKSDLERASLEAQLAQAQKLESIGRLAGGVAHDFNNHLTVINGYCDMLLAQIESGGPVQESIAEIRAAGERASALTQQLLAFSRKQVIEPSPVALNEAIDEAAKMIRRLIGEDIRMVTHADPSGPIVMADKGQVNQILLNLAVNARDAMPNGGVFTLETGAVEIDAHYAAYHPEARQGSFATLAVSDTGIGMTREVMGHIFEPFFTTKKAESGTGLGLSTVYGIVRQAGGWIRVYSEPGRGTAFTMYFPRVDATSESSASRTTVEGSLRGSETILVVEDQEDVRKLTIAALSQIGYRTIEACDGVDALRKASEFGQPIDLLFTDVVMPGMSGTELAATLTRIRPSIRVLYTSGYTEEVAGSNRILEPGCICLPKPFTAAQLALKIREALGGAASDVSA